MASASSRRREGRREFIPGGDPAEHCPYKKKNWDSHRRDWFNGWAEASRAHDLEINIKHCPCCGQEIEGGEYNGNDKQV